MGAESFQAVVRFFAVPWATFVAAFLYYVGVTLTAIGGAPLSDRIMAAAYLVPVTLYGIVLAGRSVVAVAKLPVGLRGHVGHAA